MRISRTFRPAYVMVLAVVALLAILVARGVLFSQSNGDAKVAYAEAQSFLAKRDLRSARVALMKATKADPNWAQAHLAQAEVALNLFDPVTAQASLDRALKSGAKQDRVLHLLGQASWMRGDLDEAADMLSSPYIPQKYRAFADRILARVEMDRGNLDAAKAAFDRALTITPEDSLLWTDIGRYRFVVADLKGAIDAVDYAVKIDNNNVRALEFRGRLVRSQFGLVAALPWFERALKVDPNDVPTLEEYAATLGEVGRNADMLAQLRKIVSLDSRNGRAYYMQAVIAARAGNFELARRVLPRAGSQYLELPAAMLVDAIIDYELGNYHRAIDLLDRLLAMQPRNTTVRTLLARAQQRVGEHYDALNTIQPIAERADADSYAQMLAARSFEATGERDRAAGALDAAEVASVREMLVEPDQRSLISSADEARRNPDSARVIIPYIRNLMKAGDLDNAILEAQRLANANPGVADAHLLVGDVEMARGKTDAAISSYQKVRDISFNEPVMLRLVDALRKKSDFNAARNVLTAYLTLNPTNLSAQRLMAYDHLDNGRWNAAIPLLQQVKRRLGVYDGMLLANLARAYSGAGNHKAAIAEAELAYRIDPANAMVTRIYGQVLFKAGARPKAAAELLEKAALLMPDNLEVARELANARAASAKTKR